MITTTLNKIRAQGPCENGWRKLLKHLGKTTSDDEPLPFATILESNGLEDALWCCRASPEYHHVWRLLAVWCARQVQHLTTDPRSIAVLDVAERFADGQATQAELDAAWDAARDAARDAASAAAWDAASADAWDAASDVARDAASAAAWDAASADARDAASADARDAAWDAARVAQAKQFLKLVGKPRKARVA